MIRYHFYKLSYYLVFLHWAIKDTLYIAFLNWIPLKKTNKLKLLPFSTNLKSTIHWKAYVNLFILCNSYGSWQVWTKVHPIFIDLSSSSPFIKEDWSFFWRKFACFEHAVSAFISPHNGGTWVTTRYNWTRPCFVEIRGHLNAFLNLNLSVSLSRGSNTQYTGIYKRSFGIVLRYESTPQRK